MINIEKWTSPVSNGPFRIISMDEESIVLHKNNYYWHQNEVTLNKIVIKFPGNADEAAHLWNYGEARWIAGDVNIDALTDLSGIQYNVMFATHYYFIRSEHPPWNDKRVRRAMTLVLPWEELREVYFLPAETLIFPLSGYPVVEGISEPNYEEAFSLMTEAGHEDGSKLPELVIRITPSRDAQRVAILMANAWKEILKFNVRVEVKPFDRFFDSFKEGGFTVSSITWIGDFADPYAFLQMWKSDSNLNDALFNDFDFDTLINRSMLEEGETRLALLAEAEKLLLDRGAVLPLSYAPALNIIDLGEIDGWFPNALDIHPFKYLSYKAFSPLPGIAFSGSK
jgi:peptide/nickel transport system substrate-binding protein/oligopeptide transport system substrate-binding protein